MITVAGASFITYLIAGFVPIAFIALPIAIVLMISALLLMKKVMGKKQN